MQQRGVLHRGGTLPPRPAPILKNVATEAVATLSELARQGVDLSTLQRPGGSGSPLNRN